MSRAAFVLLLAGALGCAALTEASPASSRAPGVIVEKVGAGSLGERAGLKPGDVLDSWQLQPSFPANPFPAAGWLATPFDLLEALIEQAPRGKLTLAGSRAGSPRSWTLIEGASVERAAIVARPSFEGEASVRYQAALRHLEEGEIDMGLADYRAASAAAFAEHDSLAGLWLRYRSAEVRLERMHPGWETVPREVASLLAAAGQAVAAAELYAFSGDQWAAKGDGVRAAKDWRRAQSCLARRAPRSLASARLEAGLSRALQAQQRFDLATAPLRSAFEIRAAEAPWSLDLAESLLALSDSASWAREPFPQRLEPILESEILLRRLDPGSVRHIRRLLRLGQSLRVVGQVERAEQILREAQRLVRIVAPFSYEAGSIYKELAFLATNRTALQEAETDLRTSVDIFERLPPTRASRQQRSSSLAFLGWVSAAKGDLEAAEYQGRLAIAAEAELGPMGAFDEVAAELLASTLLGLGRFDESRDLLSLALSKKPREGGNSRNRARTLRILGELELRAGKDLGAAARALQEAQDLYAATGMGRSLSFAGILYLQGELEGALGHHERALGLLAKALALLQAIVPDGTDVASTLRLIGRQHQALGRRTDASRYFCDATRTLDLLGDRVGRSNAGSSSFFASKLGFYSDCLEELVSLDHTEKAFQVLESGHARGLLEIMAFRDLSTSELSVETREERKRLRDRYESLYSPLSGSGESSAPERDLATRHELATLQMEIEALTNRMRQESPRFAAVHFPKPLNLGQARRALDPGTVLLAYSVGESHSFLFVVQAEGAKGPGLTVHHLPISSERLRQDVHELTTRMKDRHGGQAETRSRSRALYRLLIAPAASAIATGERILIAPDGPLHGLPFAALVRPDGRYLIEAKPIHTIASATVYAEIKKERREKGPSEEFQVAAFGDPVYSASATQSGAIGETEAGLTLRGISLTPLPGTRREVEAIGALYPNSQVFVGAAATEEQIKALGQAPRALRILHFAGHAVLDPRMPINSFLALSLPEHPAPGQENGLLHAWEIFEQMRLDADLVTLSACNTALGKEMGGEGLIGLTRAFQFAGARSVLASLWAIGDGATARFMPRFYEHLRQGMTKDEALRQTQIEWIRDPQRSHPSHWAAFELIGDYR